jgi:hypothetical protein
MFGVGAFCIATLFASMFNIGLLNRRRRDPIARVIRHTVILTFITALRGRTYDRVQDGLAWVLPIFVMCLIGTWFALVQIGFTLIIFAAGSESGWLSAFIASGSALSTLGFLTPTGTIGHLLAIPEGAVGLGIIVFLFTFLPGYQTAIQLREEKVAWLYARTGPNGGGRALLEWIWRAHSDEALVDIWSDWESFFRQLVETHALNPLLVLVPTVYSRQAWIVAALSVLDAAALTISSLDTRSTAAARICLEAGASALHEVGLGLPVIGHRPNGSIPADRTIYDLDWAAVVSAGAPVKADREAAWEDFQELRNKYATGVILIARATLVPAGLVAGWECNL